MPFLKPKDNVQKENRLMLDSTTKTIIGIGLFVLICWGSVYCIVQKNCNELRKNIITYSNYSRIYQVVDVLEEDNGYLSLTIKPIEEEETIKVKIPNDINDNLESNKTYEFIFQYRGNKFVETPKAIFAKMTIIDIKEVKE